MQAPEDDRALLVAAAERAGEIARQFHGKDPEVFDKGPEGPVTEADLAIDRMLRETLLAARPDYGWLSEETEDSAARLDAEHVFIVDPIDGTRAFIEGGRSFSHSLAVVRNGTVTAAAVFLPLKDRMYAASLGAGATLNGAGLQVRDATLDGAEILTTKANLTDMHWPGGVPPVKRVYRPSLAYRMALVGEGRFAGMMTFRPTWEWDIAAGALLISEAGGLLSDGGGGTLRFNNPIPQVAGVIAAGRDVHEGLIARRL